MAALCFALGCSQAEKKIELPAAQDQASSEATVNVDTQKVERHTLAVAVHATGSTRAAREAKLATETTARIEQVRVEEGDEVDEGQLLVRLDMREEQLQAAQAKASAAQAKVQASQAQTEHQRLRPLAESGAIASTRADDAKARMKAAEQAARAAEAAAEAAHRRLRTATIRAPFAGTVVDVPVEAGEVATGGSTTLVRLLDLSALEIHVQVHERDLARLSEGDRVDVHVPSTGTDAQGDVTRIGWELDERTRTGEVVIRVPNAERALRAGMFAEATIHPATTREGLVVPHSALGGAEEEHFVYVIEAGTAHRRPVEARPIDGDRWEIIQGLKPGETVVTSGLNRLGDGARVKPAAGGDGHRERDSAPTPPQPEDEQASR